MLETISINDRNMEFEKLYFIPNSFDKNLKKEVENFEKRK